MYSRERMKQSKYIQEPQHHHNHHDCIQDRLDAPGHRDIAVHQPKEYAHDDQGQQNLNERHSYFSFLSMLRDTSTLASPLPRAPSGVDNPRDCNICTHGWTASPTQCLIKVSFDILDACENGREQAPGMDWPTNQPYFGIPILCAAK